MQQEWRNRLEQNEQQVSLAITPDLYYLLAAMRQLCIAVNLQGEP